MIISQVVRYSGAKGHDDKCVVDPYMFGRFHFFWLTHFSFSLL